LLQYSVSEYQNSRFCRAPIVAYMPVVPLRLLISINLCIIQLLRHMAVMYSDIVHRRRAGSRDPASVAPILARSLTIQRSPLAPAQLVRVTSSWRRLAGWMVVYCRRHDADSLAVRVIASVYCRTRRDRTYHATAINHRDSLARRQRPARTHNSSPWSSGGRRILNFRPNRNAD